MAMKDQFAEISMKVMEDIINGNTKNFDEIKEREEKSRKANYDKVVEERKIRESKIAKWVRIASEIIDEELIDQYRESLTSFVMYGAGTGELMDLSLEVLKTLHDSSMEEAAKMLSLAEKGMDIFFIQNMAFMYSDKGPDFCELTFNRELTAEEQLTFDLKRTEIQRRKNDKNLTEISKGVNQ